MGALCLTLLPAKGAERMWHAISGGRYTDLQVPSGGKPGFTLLAPDQTRILFTNTLQEAEGASNRVLFNGSGVAAGDFDGDGWPDLYFCSLNGQNTLFKNLGGWRFVDVTEQAGLKRDRRYYRGAVFADVNGDGALDLLVGVVGAGVQCFLNDGHGKFTDATTAARTASPYASSTLALADVDGNGTLDLYVANNRKDDIRDRGRAELHLVDGKLAVPPELQGRLLVVNGQVLEYGEPDQLYINDGRGHFAPVSWTGGRFRNEEGAPLTEAPLDWGLTAAFRDLNGDGFPDLYVCNDFWTPDRVWLNDGKGRFRAAPRLALRNMCASSMGVDFADIDRDGFLDFFVVDMLSRDPRLRKRQGLAQPPVASPIGVIEDRPQFMRNTLFHNRGDNTFEEIANFAGVMASEWSWSPVFLDVDLDGYEDLLITSGHARDVQDLDAQRQVRARQHSWKNFTNEAQRQEAFTRELMEHMRLYPELRTPIVAFRNRGDLRFEDVTPAWGTATPGVHHALALADLDQDGDLDLIVNNLGSAAGIYRNDTSAPRVAVRLRGLAGNVQGIGATVRLLGATVPRQSLEVVSGGRYLAGSEPLLVFAPGSVTQGMTIEVSWRSGRQSRIQEVSANRLYELDEPSAPAPAVSTTAAATASRAPLFLEVSSWIQHRHHEEEFNDLSRQPLLPRRLTRLGPGVAWFDLDGDGFEDLIIPTGRGGTLACYRNVEGRSFRRESGPPFDLPAARVQTTVLGRRTAAGAELLVGSSNYEDASADAPAVLRFDLASRQVTGVCTGGVSSTGPLALGDLDLDGDLDLFVGGRVVPGRYPEPAPSRIFRWESGGFQLDTNNTAVLQGAGLVSGAVWSDLDGDGWPELILACEWGPVRVFQNRSGRLVETTAQLGLADFTGWWNSITTGDLDGDGRPDLVAGNWGWNGEETASRERPLPIFFGDFLDRGMVNLVESEWDPVSRDWAARRSLDALAGELPMLQEQFHSHLEFSQATLKTWLAPFQSRVRQLSVTTLASTVFLNRGDHFEPMPMPREAQWAPVFGVVVADFDGDGHEDVFLAQNFFATRPGTPRLDAGRGLLLRGEGNGKLHALGAAESGLEIYGEQRGAAAADFDGDGRTDLVVTQNGAATRLWRNASARAGLRVRLMGPPDNPHGVGTSLRVKFGARLGPAREIHAGSGYWSQDGAVPVLATPEAPNGLMVHWPGGQTVTVPVAPSAREIAVTNAGPWQVRRP
ncbi:MAG TPA: VCBS repeat-containing protein [Candidatus Saccharimonadales bacterium]|nr:VCBS repeat-containing protein [Candidatus Saccharimonadales bacterium]